MVQSQSPRQRKKEFVRYLKSDFRNFLYHIWKHLGLPDPTPIQYEIAYYLQHGPTRSIIEGYRGVGKSWITSAFVCWCLLNDPDEKILVVSASKQRADDFTTFTLKLIKEVPVLKFLAPKKDDLWRESKIAFDVGPCRPAHAPSVKSAGIFGQITGSRATKIIPDDVEIPNNSATQEMREKLLKAVSEFEAIIVPGGRIQYLGTPQTEETIYNTLQERGYECRVWPALYPNSRQVYRGNLAPGICEALDSGQALPGEPVDPKRFTLVDLMERKASYGSAGFALQFQLDTTLSDAEKYPLKTGDLVVLPLGHELAPSALQWGSGPEQVIKDIANLGFTGDRWHRPMFLDKEWVKYEGSVMAIDPSGRGADEMGIAIVNQLHGKLFALEVTGLQGGYAAPNLERIAELAKDYKVKCVIVESNFGDGMFVELLKPILTKAGYPVKVEEVRHSTQKEARIIDTLEPVMNQHRLVFAEKVVREDVEVAKERLMYSLFYQMTRINRERGALKHDDRLDALAIAVAYWVQAMARDSDKAVDHMRARALDDELRVFVEHCVTGAGSDFKKSQQTGFVKLAGR